MSKRGAKIQPNLPAIQCFPDSSGLESSAAICFLQLLCAPDSAALCWWMTRRAPEPGRDATVNSRLDERIENWRELMFNPPATSNTSDPASNGVVYVTGPSRIAALSRLNRNVTVSRFLGRHTVKAGFDFRTLHDFGTPVSGPSSFGFSTLFTQRNPLFTTAGTGASLATFLLGYLTSGSMSVVTSFDDLVCYYAAFVHDDFRVTQKLTLNFGLRLEHESGIHEENNELITGFDPNVTSLLNVSMDDVVGLNLAGTSQITSPSGPQNAYNPGDELSLSTQDLPNRFSAAITYELPFGYGKRFLGGNRWLDLAIGGWSVNAFGVIQSGYPLSVTQPNNNAVTGASYQRPNATGTSQFGVITSQINNPGMLQLGTRVTF